MFNNSDIGYLEGFTTPTDSTNISTKLNNVTTPQNTLPTKAIIASDKKQTVTGSSMPAATEGFNTIDNERNIQKGKASNSISVNSSMRGSTSNSIEPFEGGSLFGNFGLY
jgi:hypothetical protein